MVAGLRLAVLAMPGAPRRIMPSLIICVPVISVVFPRFALTVPVSLLRLMTLVSLLVLPATMRVT